MLATAAAVDDNGDDDGDEKVVSLTMIMNKQLHFNLIITCLAITDFNITQSCLGFKMVIFLLF